MLHYTYLMIGTYGMKCVYTVIVMFDGWRFVSGLCYDVSTPNECCHRVAAAAYDDVR